ncbi:hypothetical protein SAMN04489760_1055 [Syntrophus gentianae]|uniref:MetA-pathway of phenol degradation n=1 Tax=Syntrophus gentianae TaxID=43775 RepID=A0A1H7VXS3_9BACT|nr:hypothetical protein [Syntrophus gentianae]SEM13597.1 hypothetical protein SAMN04489760_1055 [Syntrophus gentianae]
MKAFVQGVAVIVLLMLGIILGTYSYAQDAAPEKAVEQTILKPGMKAIPEDLTANFNAAFYSKYVWRGLELSKDSLVIFPSVTVGYKGFAVNVWVDFDTDFNNPARGKEDETKIQETDLTLTYSNKISPLKLDYTVGWIYYDTDGFNGDSPTTNQEVFVTLALDLLLKPTLSVYREIETGEAWYTSLSVSHGFKIYQDWTWDMGGWVSYYNNKSTEDFSDLHDGNVWTGLTVPVNSFFSIIPKIQYSFPLSSNARERIKASSFNGRDSDFFYGGISFDFKI